MELIYYLGLAVLSIFFSLRRDVISSKRFFFIFWIIAYSLLVLVVRSTFDGDINTYASSMSHSSLSIYYLKEPVVWLGQRYLFSWLQDPFYVFLSTDLFVGLLLFRALKNFNLPQYAFFSILIFFPFVLGMQNVYRQWVANIIFLYSFSLVWNQRGSVKRYAAFMLSVMTHNVAAIFVPLLFIRKRKVIGKLIWYGAFLVAILGIKLGADTKSSADTGSDLTLVYLFVITFFIFLIPLLDRGVIRKFRSLEYKLLGSLFLLSSGSIMFLSSAGSERVSMFCLMVAYPILVLLFEDRFKQKFLIRTLFSLLGFIPMLLFGVSKFILGA
jgi:hypothetical protein